MIVSWFSAGCSSFAATYLMRDSLDRIVYIDVSDQHPDSMRFVADAEEVLGIPIEVIKSEKYASVEDVIKRRRYINGPTGAPCTRHLKREVRELWERENLDDETTYVWGYDVNEVRRARNMMHAMWHIEHEFPLIDELMTKEDCHALCRNLGIKRPVMYDMGYRNNNCVGCVKGGMGYWNKIRVDFPEVFRRRAELERLVGRSCINGVFLDELDPARGRFDMEVMPSCYGLCERLELEFVD